MAHYDEFELEQMVEDVKAKSIVEQLADDKAAEVEFVPLCPTQPLKQSEGKAKGARYCYLGEHSLAMNLNKYYQLETMLKDLTDSVDMKNTAAVKHCCEMALHAVRDLDDDFITNLCGVRANAVASGKYQLYGYRKAIPIEELLDAAARHFLKIIYIGDIDEESGFHHLGHIAANLLMINTQARLHKL